VDEGGTILLDEVGDMPLELQAKFLRAIENREIIRVGSDKIRKIKNVKIIAATNRPLEDMIAEGTFRKDLYGRLRSEEIMVPNLEERSLQHRMELIGHFLQLLGRQYEKTPGMTQEAFDFLMSDKIDYQENVRGLRDHLERAFKVASATAGKKVDIDYNHVITTVPYVAEVAPDEWKRPEEGEQDEYFGGALNIGFSDDGSKMDVQFDFDKFNGNGNAMVEAMFKVLCHAVVRHCGNNQSKAAKVLNITRGTLRMKLRSRSVVQNVDTKVSFAIDTDGAIEETGTGR